jgi:23S rRNA (uracil1939-C5)-methyltransferase
MNAVTPPCRHFGTCGGCALQHLASETYRAGKRALVVDALARQRLDIGCVADLVSVPPASRRIARFGAHDGRGAITVGFTERAGKNLIDVEECPVLASAIVAALPALRALAAIMLKPGEFADIPVTLTASGLDVVLRTAREPDGAARSKLAEAAREASFARLSWQKAGRDRRHVGGPPEPIAAFRSPRVMFSGVPFDLPPAAFLQPTAEGEAVLTRAVVEALAGRKRVADLYAGCGPFTLALAKSGAHVRAVEMDAAMTAALDAAARRAELGPMVVAETRDLVRRPLQRAELDKFDGVVLDPPRPGAGAQVRELAGSKVPVVVYASCNPQSFASDARVLVDGGYTLERVVPLDQFLWSPHVELVAVLRR